MSNKKDIEEITIYTNLTFTNDDITVVVRNILLEELTLFTDKEKIIEWLMYYKWYLHGIYERVFIEEIGITVTILSRTKKKIELMVNRGN